MTTRHRKQFHAFVQLQLSHMNLNSYAMTLCLQRTFTWHYNTIAYMIAVQ